jgi:hypothetical protein
VHPLAQGEPARRQPPTMLAQRLAAACRTPDVSTTCRGRSTAAPDVRAPSRLVRGTRRSPVETGTRRRSRWHPWVLRADGMWRRVTRSLLTRSADREQRSDESRPPCPAADTCIPLPHARSCSRVRADLESRETAATCRAGRSGTALDTQDRPATSAGYAGRGARPSRRASRPRHTSDRPRRIHGVVRRTQ